MKLLIIESFFSKMAREEADIIIIGLKTDRDVTGVFFKKEEEMDKAIEALSEDFTVNRKRKQIVFLKNETMTALTLRRIFTITEIIFAR